MDEELVFGDFKPPPPPESSRTAAARTVGLVKKTTCD
jgi:hypothetical protein